MVSSEQLNKWNHKNQGVKAHPNGDGLVATLSVCPVIISYIIHLKGTSITFNLTSMAPQTLETVERMMHLDPFIVGVSDKERL